MIKKVIIINDSHLDADEEPHPSYQVAKKFIKAQKPDILILNGDMLGFDYLSSYNESKAQLKEGKRLKKDIDMMKGELDFFYKHAGEVIYLGGNHEDRLRRRIEETPEYEGLLSLDKLLDVKIIPETEQPIRIAKSHLHVLHGKNYGVHFTLTNLRQYMVNVACGHCHRVATHTMRGLDKELGSYGIGCLTNRNPYYLNGKMNQWENGLGLAYINDNRNYTFYNIQMIDSAFMFEGKLWE